MTIKYLKKATKTASTDDTKTKEIVQNLLKELEKSKEEGCKELKKKLLIQNQKLRLRKYLTPYLLLMRTIQLDLLQQIQLLKL